MKALSLLSLITLIFFFTLSAIADTKAEIEQLKKQIEEFKLAKQKEQEKKSLAEKADLLRKELLELKKNQRVSQDRLKVRRIGDKELLCYKDGSKNPFTGVRVRKHGNGSVYSECFFENGLKNGEQIVYTEKGTKYREAQWANGLKEGLETIYHPNGWKLSETNYSKGKKNGLEIIYQGPLIKKEATEYLLGEKHGKRAIFYNDGSTSTISTYQKGKKWGIEIEYRRDGSVFSEKKYINGEVRSSTPIRF